MYYPNIIEKTGRSTKTYDLPTKLLQQRIVYLAGDINEELANSIIMQLLWLNADNPDKDISLYINSLGGNVYQGLGIKDCIDSIDCKVNTSGIGICASIGAYLLAAGTGERSATKNCRIMLHSVSSGTVGVIHDMETDFNEAKFLQNTMMQDISTFTKGNMSIANVKDKLQRDYYMSSAEALQFGLIDSILD